MKIIRKRINLKRSYINYCGQLVLLSLCLALAIPPLQAAQAPLAESQLSIKIVNKPMTVAIKEIENKTNCVFFFQEATFDSSQRVTVEVDNMDLPQILDKMFADTGHTYTINERQVFVKKAKEQANQLSTQQADNKISVSGLILDEQGIPVIGASIAIKGTAVGTLSDTDGKFILNNLTPNAQVTVSFIGYTVQYFAAEKNKEYKIILKEDQQLMEEVVVVGYGTQRRSLVTSAISKLKIDESNMRQVSSPSQLLDGRVAGVSVNTGSGNLGSGERLTIRGSSSLSASNEPLYVVDGVPISNSNAQLFNFGESMSSLSALNLTDIESIEILKDAASASIYGSRATNGVVVITTKSGKEGRSDIRVNVSTGLSHFANKNKIKFADSDMYLLQYNEGIDNYNEQYGLKIGDSKYKKRISNPFQGMPDTDWLDLIIQTGTFYNVDGSFSGGNKKTKYYIGVNYTEQEGIIKNNSMEKLNFRARVSHQFTPWLEVGANNTANYIKNNQIPGATLGSMIIARAVEQRPFDRPYKPNGDYYIGGTDELTRHNPVQILNEQTAYFQNFRYLGNYYALAKFLNKFSWKYSFNADVGYTYDYKNYNENHPYGAGGGRVVDNNRLITNILSENVVTYDDKFLDNFSLSAMAGHSFQKISSRTSMIDGRGFPSPSFNVISVASEIQNASGNISDYAMESYFGRATLSYLDRYILTASIRTDGSSKFAPKKRWGLFPSVSVGWNVSEEDFMKDLGTELKFRMSYGKTGNQEGIGNYAYQALLSGGKNYGNNSGIAVSGFGNEELTWETADQYDIGFDATFLKGKINVMFDVYMKNTNNLLYNMPTHAVTGATSVISNIGKMQNYGAEFTLNTHFNLGRVEWLSQFNISTNRNKIKALIGDDKPISIGDNRALQVGKSLGAFYIFKSEGIYQYDGEVPQAQYDLGVRAGDVKWYDADDNGIINDNDRQVMGSSSPDFFGGWNNTFKYKNFQLDVFLTYMSGNDVYAVWKPNGAGRIGYRMGVLKEYVENRWTGPASSTVYPRAIDGETFNTRNSDRWLEDGSFIRLRSLTLGYNLPQSVLKNIGCKALRVYFQGDNLFLLTRYSGWDPEVSTNMDPRYMGIDQFSVPQPRTYSFGVNVNF